MEGCFTLQWGGGGGRGGLAFRWGSFLFKLKGGAPMGDIGFDGGFEKNCTMGGAPPLTMGNPASSLTIVDNQTLVC